MKRKLFCEIGNIIASQWSDTCIYFSCSFYITLESNIAEVCLNKSTAQGYAIYRKITNFAY